MPILKQEMTFESYWDPPCEPTEVSNTSYKVSLPVEADVDSEVNGLKRDQHIYKIDTNIWRLMTERERMELSATFSYQFYNAWGNTKSSNVSRLHTQLWGEGERVCENSLCPDSARSEVNNILYDPFDVYQKLIKTDEHCDCCTSKTHAFWSYSRTREYIEATLENRGSIYIATDDECELIGWNWLYTQEVDQKLSKGFILDDEGNYRPIKMKFPRWIGRLQALYLDTAGLATDVLNNRGRRKYNKNLVTNIFPGVMKSEILKVMKRNRGIPIVITRTKRNAQHVIDRAKESLKILGVDIMQFRGKDIYGAPERVFMAPKLLKPSAVRDLTLDRDKTYPYGIGALDGKGSIVYPVKKIPEEMSKIAIKQGEKLEFSSTIIQLIDNYENGNSLTQEELNSLRNLRRSLKYGDLADRLEDLGKNTIKGAAISNLFIPVILSTSALVAGSSYISESQGLLAISGIIAAWESIPGLGGVSSWIRVLAIQMKEYFIPEARKMYNEEISQTPLGISEEQAFWYRFQAMMKSLAYGGFPLMTFWDGGWAFSWIPELLREADLRRVVYWNLREKIKHNE